MRLVVAADDPCGSTATSSAPRNFCGTESGERVTILNAGTV